MNTEQRTDTGLVLRIDSPVIDATMQNELTAERINAAIEQIKDLRKDRESFLPDNDICADDVAAIDTALAALRAEQERNNGCELCGRRKPIKAFTILPECGLQYKTAIIADFCPACGRLLTEGGESK